MARRKITRMIHVGLYEPHDTIIKKAEEAGFNVSEQIRNLIMEWGENRFPETPAYAEALKIAAEVRKTKLEKKMKFELMPEAEYATKVLHGKLLEGGAKVGFKIANGQTLTLPLAGIKEHTPENNALIDVHNKLYNRTFIFPNGQVPKPDYFDKMFEGWDETPEDK